MVRQGKGRRQALPAHISTLRDEIPEPSEAWRILFQHKNDRNVPPALLMRALAHAARSGYCVTVGTAAEEVDPNMLVAARLYCLLQIAIRDGAFDPQDDREVYEDMLSRLPSAWRHMLKASRADLEID